MEEHEIVFAVDVAADRLELWVKAVLNSQQIPLPATVKVKMPSAEKKLLVE